MRRLVLASLPLACADPNVPADPPDLRPGLPELAVAVDHDPDPAVVEVHLEATAAQLKIRERPTDLLLYRDTAADPTLPGPLIVADLGDTLVVRFTNRVADRTTTVHWHGLRLPDDMDGNPARSGAVDPDETFEYRFPLRDPGLYWYHPHVDTDEQQELGLHGPLLVRGQGEPPVDRERILVLDDLDLGDDDQLRLDPDHDDLALGRHGDVILVNGHERPGVVAGAGTTERWRIVNAANGRHFALTLAGHRFTVIGGDRGPLPAPLDRATLRIVPGERYDVLVTIADAPGATLWLRSAAVDRGHAVVPAVDVLELHITEPDAPPIAVDPAAFTAPFTPLPVAADTPSRDLRLGEDLDHELGPRFTINDELWPFNTPIHANLGDLEVWSLINEGPGEHPFHLHGAFFQLLRDDGTIDPAPGWKDTVRIGPEATVRIAVRHETPGMWMYHCQLPEHAERGMMGDLMVDP